MIGYLAGEVKKIGDDYIVVFIKTSNNFGIGYKIHISEKYLESISIGDMVKLYTHHYQTEKTEDLYGFEDLPELDMFERLISVSGVGPSASQKLLSSLTAKEITQAITNGNVEALTVAKGLGKKSAQKIIAELSDAIAEGKFSSLNKSSPQGQALEALIELGYNRVEAKAALRMVEKKTDDPEELVKQALKNLS